MQKIMITAQVAKEVFYVQNLQSNFQAFFANCLQSPDK